MEAPHNICMTHQDRVVEAHMAAAGLVNLLRDKSLDAKP